jgi:hypothetical protein
MWKKIETKLNANMKRIVEHVNWLFFRLSVFFVLSNPSKLIGSFLELMKMQTTEDVASFVCRADVAGCALRASHLSHSSPDLLARNSAPNRLLFVLVALLGFVFVSAFLSFF